MKNKQYTSRKRPLRASRYFSFLLLTLFLLGGCYKEKALTPTGITSIGEKFTFPQGSSPADAVFERIDGRYSVKVIYKDFTQGDINRSWLSPSGQDFIKTEWRWNYLTDEQTASAAGTLEQKVFSLLPDSIVRAGTRSYPYFYLIDGLYPVSSGLHLPLYPTKALDGMAINLELSASPDNYTHKVFFPLRVATEIFIAAYARGDIRVPEEFFAGLDEKDNVSYNAANNPLQGGGPGTERYERFWARRGRIPFVSLEGLISIGENTTHNSSRASAIEPLSRRDSEVAYFFMFLSLDKHWRSRFEPGNLFHDCPLLESRITMFYNRMKNVYGIDLDAIQEKLYAGTDVDTSPDRIYDYVHDKDKNHQTFIYTLD
jgi:hypothetical protein